jgi:predicted ATP-grasp superfamily ATP-dependent carboligase
MNLIIIGASARAAAFSAWRAGLRPWCADLYADVDLRQAFPVRRVPSDAYPDGLLDALRDAPAGPVLYTGGLENHPDLLARIDRPLCGNPPEVLRRVRSPFLLAEVLKKHGLPALDVRRNPPPAGDHRRWLLKPLRSAGGVGIRTYRGQAFDPRTRYLQEFRPGRCFGALFVGLSGGRAHFVGITRMMAPGWLHVPGFHYGSSIGPRSLEAGNLPRIGNVLAQEFSLLGVFGVDAVYEFDSVTGRGRYLPLEVNPRYTASVELFERAWDVPLLGLHRAAVEGRALSLPSRPIPFPVWAKAILYARADSRFPADGPWSGAEVRRQPAGLVEYADIPDAGEPIARGSPVLTVFASGSTAGRCLRRLREKANALDRCLRG